MTCVQTVCKAIQEVLRGRKVRVGVEPQAHAIFRWPDGFPQAEVGHLERIEQIESQLPAGVALAGSSYRGIAVPDCVRQGRAAATKFLSQELT